LQSPKEGEIIYTYGRSRNPTQIALQKNWLPSNTQRRPRNIFRHGAITMALLGYCKQGDHIISAPTVYGGTFGLLKHILPDFGIQVTL